MSGDPCAQLSRHLESAGGTSGGEAGWLPPKTSPGTGLGTAPGPTNTAMMAFFHEANGKHVVDGALGAVGRYSSPEEQAWPLLFLNSPRSSYVVGETLYTDGGFFAALPVG